MFIVVILISSIIEAETVKVDDSSFSCDLVLEVQVVFSFFITIVIWNLGGEMKETERGRKTEKEEGKREQNRIGRFKRKRR